MPFIWLEIVETEIIEHVRALTQGSEKAFRLIYDFYHKKIASFCLSFGLSQEETKEVVQDTFMKLWVNKSSIEPDNNFQSYFFRIAKNIIIDKFREKSRELAAREYQLYVLKPENTTENKVLYNELQTEIKEIIDSLPDMRRLIFHMSRIKGLSNNEIARELDISVRTVETHISKALQTFHAKLGHLKAI